jgi:hypothetical protein
MPCGCMVAGPPIGHDCCEAPQMGNGVNIGNGEESQRAAQDLHRCERVEDAGVSRNINLSDTSDVIGEYAQAEPLHVDSYRRIEVGFQGRWPLD